MSAFVDTPGARPPTVAEVLAERASYGRLKKYGAVYVDVDVLEVAVAELGRPCPTCTRDEASSGVLQ